MQFDKITSRQTSGAGCGERKPLQCIWETGNSDMLSKKLLLIYLYSNQSVSPLPSSSLKESDYCVF